MDYCYTGLIEAEKPPIAQALNRMLDPKSPAFDHPHSAKVSKMITQVSMELDGLADGSNRYDTHRDRLIAAHEAATHRPYAKLIQAALPEVTKGIQEWLGSQQESHRPHSAYLPLSSLEVTQVAFLGLQATTNIVASGKDARACCFGIGKLIEEEVMASDFQKRDPKKFKRLVDRAIKEHSSRSHRVKAVKAGFAHDGAAWENWSNIFRVRVGEPVLNAILLKSEIFETFVDEETGVLHVGLTPIAAATVMEMEEKERWQRPVFYPMLQKPTPWTAFASGGYKVEEVRERVKLVRSATKDHRKKVETAIRNGQMRHFLEALNSIQETPMRVNPWALNLVKFAWRKGLSLKKFPRKEMLGDIAFPENYADLDAFTKKGWRMRASKVKKRNRQIIATALMLQQDLAIADKLLEAGGAFYLPHNCDFRGRIYPLPTFNQQRNDHVRGLLEFSHGMPLGDTGAYWLAVHLANCGDFGKISKQSFDNRVQWVEDNEEMILRIASDPTVNLEWTKADCPFSFAAACREWAGYRKEGMTFVSHLPIGLDGSNSGVQHYAAALRAPRDGSHVNLIPQDKPADIYQAVANVVLAKLKREEDKPFSEKSHISCLALAQQWLTFGVSRSTVKRNVMTFGYGSEKFGFTEQLRGDLMEPLDLDVMDGKLEAHPFGPDSGYLAAAYLASKVWEAVNEVVQEVAKGMKFFQEVAAVLASEQKPVTWATPLGFPVIHSYHQWDEKTIEVFLFNRGVAVTDVTSHDKIIEGDKVLKRVKMNLRTEPKKTLKKTKQRSAVAPNVIHSMDATHLLQTVNASVKEGISHFCLIHDSFATHAANTGRFGAIIRETFVALYENFDIFQEVHKAAKEVLSEEGRKKLPNVPPRGSLNLQEVTKSLYAFA